jgi:hypothetical protein
VSLEKKLPPTAVNQKTPDLGISRGALSNGILLFFLNRSVELKTGNLMA